MAERNESPASETRRAGEAPPARSWLARVYGLLMVLAGGIGALATALQTYRCFGYDPAQDALTRVVRDHRIIHHAVLGLIPLAIVASAVLIVAGVGLMRARRWAFKTAFAYAVSGLAIVLMSLLIGLLHFRSLLLPERGVPTATFTLSLSHAYSNDLHVTYSTRDGSATAGADFAATNGTATIPAGKTSQTIPVTLLSDNVPEASQETFALEIAPLDGIIATSTVATAIIEDEDGPPVLTIETTQFLEHNLRTKEASLYATLSHAIPDDVTVSFATADGTAIAGSDYVATNGTLRIPAWQTKGKIDLVLIGDTLAEPEFEQFAVRLSDPVNALVERNAGALIVVDDDSLPSVSMGNVEIVEHNHDPVVATIPVQISRPYPGPIKIGFATRDGTAIAGADYTPTNGTLKFIARQTNAVIQVTIPADVGEDAAREAFSVVLTNVVNAQLAWEQASVTILAYGAPPTLRISDAAHAEGDAEPKPAAAAMKELLHRGVWTGGFLLIAIPILILAFAGRRRIQQAFHIDLTSATFTTGSLTYTKLGLTALFAWLLWGDFCWTLMETAVGPSVLMLKLNELGASNSMVVLILNTLPSILNLTVCPWVSFKSDRYRSRWGRRIPFIVWTMPFLAATLVMVGWSNEIAVWMRAVIPGLEAIAPNTFSIALLAVLLIAFQFFNMFVNSVFWYLFNDVVPAQFLARFMGLFRLVGTAAGAIYNAFIFGYVETNMREILTGAAVLYFVGFGLMCLRVKEGEYPPISGEAGRPKGLLSDIKVFGKESFSVRFYWYFFIMGGLTRVAYALGIFNLLFSKQMGLSMDQIGKLGAVGSIAGMVAMYFTAVLVDRWHPMRITVYEKVFTTVAGFGGWIWMYVTLPGDLYFWCGLGGALVTAFNYQLSDAAGIPLAMRIFPKSRYGQFSSASAMVRSFGMIVGGILAGVYMDLLKWLCDGSDYAYRLMWTWIWPFNVINMILLGMAYQEWKRRGGEYNYRPPAPWNPDGFEESVDKVAPAPSKPHAVLPALYLGLAASVLAIGFDLYYTTAMRDHAMASAVRWYLYLFVPIKGLLALGSFWQILSVKRDIRVLENGGKPRLGVPHHGVFLVQAITGLVYIPVSLFQMIWMIRIDYERELILFGINGVMMTATGLLALQIIRWLERVQSPLEDPNVAPAAAMPPAAA